MSIRVLEIDIDDASCCFHIRAAYATKFLETFQSIDKMVYNCGIVTFAFDLVVKCQSRVVTDREMGQETRLKLLTLY